MSNQIRDYLDKVAEFCKVTCMTNQSHSIRVTWAIAGALLAAAQVITVPAADWADQVGLQLQSAHGPGPD